MEEKRRLSAVFLDFDSGIFVLLPKLPALHTWEGGRERNALPRGVRPDVMQNLKIKEQNEAAGAKEN
ncbi:hypothetical protein [Clostridium fessum]|uniref:hypothetical protein n=1 Tax=Clostridium fessum TaxID=2126740 RepID=UPI003999F1DB